MAFNLETPNSVLSDNPHTMRKLIGLYVGSFDPFHYGHLEVVTEMLKYVDIIKILPNVPNKHKPTRSDLNHRIAMINLTLDDYIYKDRVVVVSDNCDSYVESISSDKYIHMGLNPSSMEVDYVKIGFLGSDVYNTLVKSCKCPILNVNMWYIIPRIGTDVNEIAMWDVPVTFLPQIDFKYQHISSTLIRKLMFKNVTFKNIKNMISESVFEYILENEIYPTRNSIINFIGKNIEFDSYTFIKNNVIDIDDRAIAKIFFDRQSYMNENISNDFAKSITVINIPEILKLFNDSKYYMILFENVGVSAFDLCDKIDPYLIGYPIGKSLAKLHDYKTINLTKDLLELNSKMKSMMKLLPEYYVKEIYDPPDFCSKDIIRSIYSPKGFLTLQHGDCSLHNFVINPDDNLTSDDTTVYFIDNGKIIDSFIDSETIIGIPEYDYYQFISSVYYANIDPVIKKIIVDSFKTGYAINRNFNFNPYLEIMCATYWSNKYAGSIPIEQVTKDICINKLEKENNQLSSTYLFEKDSNSIETDILSNQSDKNVKYTFSNQYKEDSQSQSQPIERSSRILYNNSLPLTRLWNQSI